MLVEGGLRYPATLLPCLAALANAAPVFLNEMARTQKGTKTVISSALECVCPLLRLLALCDVCDATRADRCESGRRNRREVPQVRVNDTAPCWPPSPRRAGYWAVPECLAHAQRFLFFHASTTSVHGDAMEDGSDGS